MRIYTRTGDRGETGLFTGTRVSKSDVRVEAYGTVDELNSMLGWAHAHVSDVPLSEEIRAIQSDLLFAGADLAAPRPESRNEEDRSTRMDEERVSRLEARIDALETETSPLSGFILPGGDPAAGALQVCRTICRRAERRVVALAAVEDVSPTVLTYLNRLSDLLFVMARWVNAQHGVPEPLWTRDEEDEEGVSSGT
jgi:cob(I)alamin adenosyltransferase